MKPGKILVAECSCRFLVVDVRRAPAGGPVVERNGPEQTGAAAPVRLLVARCRDFDHAAALARSVSDQSECERAELWFLHGNGKGRSLELVFEIRRGTEWLNCGFTAPALSARALILPTKGPLPA